MFETAALVLSPEFGHNHFHSSDRYLYNIIIRDHNIPPCAYKPINMYLYHTSCYVPVKVRVLVLLVMWNELRIFLS